MADDDDDEAASPGPGMQQLCAQTSDMPTVPSLSSPTVNILGHLLQEAEGDADLFPDFSSEVEVHAENDEMHADAPAGEPATAECMNPTKAGHLAIALPSADWHR